MIRGRTDTGGQPDPSGRGGDRPSAALAADWRQS